MFGFCGDLEVLRCWECWVPLGLISLCRLKRYAHVSAHLAVVMGMVKVRSTVYGGAVGEQNFATRGILTDPQSLRKAVEASAIFW